MFVIFGENSQQQRSSWSDQVSTLIRCLEDKFESNFCFHRPVSVKTSPYLCSFSFLLVLVLADADDLVFPIEVPDPIAVNDGKHFIVCKFNFSYHKTHVFKHDT